MIIEYLSWDSDFFNKKIGKISYDIPDETKLKKVLEKAKTEHYQLLYIFAPERLCIGDEILKNYSGKLVDRRILYSHQIENILERNQFSEIVTLYSEKVLSNELENLAYLSGKYSRFNLDENFEQDIFRRLYKTWIIKSVQKEMADSVLIVKDYDTIVGMVTLNYGEKVGTIGLIAVSALAQGKGYGKKLINACIYDLYKRNISTLEVPTQANNISACLFYEKCGFTCKLITNIYHFWL
jgi:dTDP-4-amino-4,6-dideoxy-D-galactose acyltransferase